MTFVCGGHGTLDFLTDEDRAREEDPAWLPCCIGEAELGVDGCTCWEPVYTRVQQELRPGDVATRSTMCDDCAYRPDSEERTKGDDHEEPGLLSLPNFFCHQGTRAVREWRHPDGRVRPGAPLRDYRSPIHAAVPYKADGTPADQCAGWAAHNRDLEAAR